MREEARRLGLELRMRITAVFDITGLGSIVHTVRVQQYVRMWI